MRWIIFISCIAVVCCFPQSGSNLCGTNERGAPRQAGESWQEDCNTCRCTDKLLPGCTKRFCGAFSVPTSTLAPRTAAAAGGGGGVSFPGAVRGEPESAPQTFCTDQSGERKEVGDSWKEDCNNCRCGNTGISLCTQRLCIDKTPQTFCTDQSGERREVGESWKEDCNNCRCGDTGMSLCTLRLCIDAQEFKRAEYLFTVDTSKKTDEIIQCKSEGAKNCKAVNLNPEHLSSSSSRFLKLFPGSDVELTVTRGPASQDTPTLSYQFSLTDGGQGSLTYRQSTLALYGSFKPISGSVHYTVESCGAGCNVIYERDSNFFDQFQD